MGVVVDQEKVDAFRKFMPSKWATRPDLDDKTIMRFLIAREFNQEKTKKMLEYYLNWRDTKNIGGLDLHPIVPLRGMKVFPDQNITWPARFKPIADTLGGCAFHKFDRHRNPIYIERAGFHDTQALSQIGTIPEILEFHTLSNEFFYQKILPPLTQLPEHKDVDEMTVIFDLKGLGFHQFQIPALKMLRAIGELDHQCYPERLATLFIVNAPSIFGKFWNFVKGSFDKKVIEKTRIYPEGEDFYTALTEKIPPENIPKFLGGQCECKLDGGCVPCFLPSLPYQVCEDSNFLPITFETCILTKNIA